MKSNTKGWILISASILLLAILLFLVFDKKEFNPEDDVCLQTCGGWWEEQSDKEVRFEHKMCGKIYHESKCISWRPKNFCELNPNDQEKCVCDEYGIKEEHYYNYSCHNDEILKLCNKSSRTEEIEEIRIAMVYDCIISSTFNGYYFDECKYIYKGINYGDCVKAHEKTIYDESCERLKEALTLNIPIYYYGYYGNWLIYKTPIDREWIYKVFKEKGCEI